ALIALQRDPTFVLVAAGSLGLALAVVAGVYGLVDAATHPVSAVRDADRVVLVSNEGHSQGTGYSAKAFVDIARERQRVFRSTAVVYTGPSGYTIGGESYHGMVVAVSPEFFATTRITPKAGRVLGAVDATAGTPGALISFRVWRNALGAQQDAIGRTILVDGRMYTIVGVMPPDATWRLGSDLVLPATAEQAGTPSMIGRLRDGISTDAAREQLRADIDPLLTATFGVGRKPFRTSLATVAQLPAAMTDLHKMLLASSGLIVLIASANLANLMLARGLRRRSEYALRFALGARRSSIVCQTFAEALICALLAAAIAVLLAWWLFDTLTYGLTRDIPTMGVVAVSMNWRVFALAILTAIVAACVFGLYPALRASATNLEEALKDGASNVTRRTRLRHSPLVVSQVALTLALLMAANLLLRSAGALRDRELGFEPRGLFTVRVVMNRAVRDSIDMRQVYGSLLGAIEREPGVKQVAAFRYREPDGRAVSVTIGGSGNRRGYLNSYSEVSASYLSTLGIDIVRGRDLAPGDALAEVRTAVVSQAAARSMWRSADPIGQMITLADIGRSGVVVRVVGIAEDIASTFDAHAAEPTPALYVVAHDTVVSHTLVVRTSTASESPARLARRARSALPPHVAPIVAPYSASLDSQVATLYFIANTFVAFAVFALGLALFGVFSVRAIDVAQRNREFAVRMSLGATRGNIARSVLRESTAIVLAGTAVGAFVAMYFGRRLDDWLYGVFYTDVRALVLAEALLIATTLAASLVPALRASRANPVESLRAS
ncbi:MAG: ABC transporter permease, partial [Gemmatimonadota bacterium]